MKKIRNIGIWIITLISLVSAITAIIALVASYFSEKSFTTLFRSLFAPILIGGTLGEVVRYFYYNKEK